MRDMAKKHLIWSSEFEVEDFKDYLEEYHPEVKDEDEQYEIVAELNDLYLDDERVNLNIPCPIIGIADLGLWNGRFTGFKLFDNLKDIFTVNVPCSLVEWYVEGVTLKGTMSHHDGTNYIKYYKFMKDLNGADDFLHDLVNGVEISKSRFYKYCKSAGKLVKEVYGF